MAESSALLSDPSFQDATSQGIAPVHMQAFPLHGLVRRRDLDNLKVLLRSASYRIRPGHEDDADPERLKEEACCETEETIRQVKADAGRIYSRWQLPPASSQMLKDAVNCGPHCIDGLDDNGNTPLHYAVAQKDTDLVELLLTFGANSGRDNSRGWTPLDDAVQLQHRPLTFQLYRNTLRRTWETWQSRLPKVFDALARLPDYHFELKWDFHSFIPFVSNLCPSDRYKVWKRGTTLRLDYSLIEYANMKSKRGNMSFIFMGRDTNEPGECYVIDWDKKVKLRPLDGLRDPLPRQIICFVDNLLTTDAVNGDVNIENVACKRKNTWRGVPKTENVSNYTAEVHELHATFEFVTKVRTTVHPPESEIDDEWIPDDLRTSDANIRRPGTPRARGTATDSDCDSDSDEFYDADEVHGTTTAMAHAKHAQQKQKEEEGGTTMRDGAELVSSEAEIPATPTNLDEVEIIDVDKPGFHRGGQASDSNNNNDDDDDTDADEYARNLALMEQARTAKRPTGEDGQGEDGEEGEAEEDEAEEEGTHTTETVFTQDGEVDVTIDRKTFKTTLAAVPDFAINIYDLLPIIEVLTPVDHPFTKAKDFLKMNLPGFPLKCNVPLYAALSVQYEFLSFEERGCCDFAHETFCVPDFKVIRRVPLRHTPEVRASIRQKRRDAQAKKDKKKKKAK